ncbi:MAG: leucine-rich repeat domain-containing protein [Lachnospiraceae bacterium]|nr:leucine-rich repeat domain-containing protein [Lachnospiraceae bacterium]
MEMSIDTEKGTLYYAIKEERVTITTYHGNDSVVEVPAKLEGFPVRKIGKKAFMNSRQLRRVVLPDSVKKLGEWAFAYCSLLEEVVLPRRRITVGTGVFLGDKMLTRIVLRCRQKNGKLSSGEADLFWSRQEESYRSDIAVLLAAVPGMEDGEYLLDFKEAGDHAWIVKWDARLRRFIEEPDEKGYTQMILCGEEDINCSLDNYVREKRKKKVRYCFLRLLHDSGLTAEMKQTLEEYLICHSVGCASMETWLVLKEEKGHLREYYELYVRLNCLNDENYDATLADLGSQHPEMKAYFMREHGQQQETGADFFDTFSL